MKTLKSLILIITALMTILSCSTSDYNRVIDNHITFDTDDLSELTFNDLYELDTVIQLEDNDSAYFGDVRNLLLTDDKIVIISGGINTAKDYHVFDKKGKFLYKNNRHGRGPGEYYSIGGSAISGDSVIVISSNKQLCYDIEDRSLLAEDQYSNGAVRFTSASYLRNGQVLKNIGYTIPDSKDGKCYAFQRFDKKGKLLGKYLDMPENKTPLFTSISTMLSTNKKIYCSPLTHCSISEYDIETEIFRELYSLSIKGGPAFDINNISDINWVSNKTMFFLGDAGDNYLLLFFSHNKTAYYAYISNGKVELISKDNFTDLENELTVYNSFSHSGKLISIIESESDSDVRENCKIAIYSHKQP